MPTSSDDERPSRPTLTRRASLGATLTSLVKATIKSDVDGNTTVDDMAVDTIKRNDWTSTASRTFVWAPPEIDCELSKAKNEIVNLQAQLSEESYRHELEVSELRRQYTLMKERLEVMGRDVKDKQTIHEYAKMIKEAAPKRTDSSYVLRLQSQMAKALHELGIMGNQLTVLKQSSSEVVQSLHAEMSELVNEKCRREMECMNELIKMEGEKKAMKEFYEENAKAKDAMIDLLRNQLQEARAQSGNNKAVTSDNI